MNKQCLLKAVSEILYSNQNEYYKEKEVAYFTGKMEGAIFADFHCRFSFAQRLKWTIPAIFGTVA
jgi:hypothetical protein